MKKSSLVIAATALSNPIGLFNASSARGASELPFKPHAFLEIATDDTITVWVGQTNLGQGTHTGIPMIIAEELDAAWEKVQVKMAVAAEPFKDPQWHAQLTGGSTSIRHRWDMLRKVGAAARQMLIEAAAEQWGVPWKKCVAQDGQVLHPDGRGLTYGQLAETAASRPAPEDPPLKDPKDYRIIGTKRERLDIPDKVMGRTVYGFDFTTPEMCVAVVALPPRYGASFQSYNEKAAMAVKGVIKVAPLEDRIAVCAETAYAAIQGRNALDIQWSEGSHPDLNDETIDAVFKAKLEEPGAVAENSGDVNKALAEAAQTIEQSYKLPYISHAQMEPINCTAHVEKERCRIWAPTQGQTAFQMTAAKITGLPEDKIEVMTTPAGGGFGRRGEVAVAVDALLVSKALGRPVKVVRTREDDFKHGYYRPGYLCRIQGGLDADGRLIAWNHKVASPYFPQFVENDVDQYSLDGVTGMDYDLPNKLVEEVKVDLPIPLGFWRSVGNTTNTFAVESFMDELATAAGKDPVEFRLGLMQKDSRPYRTLKLAAEKAKWGSPVPAGRGRGVAVRTCFGSSAAHVAEVSVDTKTGAVKVHKIVCALDCGPAVYPDAIVAQMEGAAIMALSVAFKERVQFDKGGVKTANYDQYPLLTMSQVPEIEVHIAESRHNIGGVGEPGVPPVAPAVANAIFNATGVRLRELPFKTELLAKS